MIYVMFIMSVSLTAPPVGVGEYATKEACEARVLRVIEHGVFAYCEPRTKGFIARGQ